MRGTDSYSGHGGAGIFVADGILGATNCVIADNRDQFGDGLFLRWGNASLVNCTLSYNQSGARSWDGNLSIINSIVFFNSEQQVRSFSGPNPQLEFSDVQDGYPGIGNITQNPIFQSRTNYMLVTGSPCIDRGHKNAVYNDMCFPPSKGGQRNDMGAFGGPGACDWATGDIPLACCLTQRRSIAFYSLSLLSFLDEAIMSTVNVQLTEELLTIADVPDAQPSRSTTKLIALELFREGRVSLGKAAELAGVSVEEFMAFSAKRDVPLHYTMAHWEADQITARRTPAESSGGET